MNKVFCLEIFQIKIRNVQKNWVTFNVLLNKSVILAVSNKNIFLFNIKIPPSCRD